MSEVDFNAADYAEEFEGVETRTSYLEITVKKPNKEWFCRTHREAKFWFSCQVLQVSGMAATIYLIKPDIRQEVAEEFADFISPRRLVLTTSFTGEVFWWPLKLSAGFGINEWNASAEQVAVQMRDKWLQLRAMSGSYYGKEPVKELIDPVWPDITLESALQRAFKHSIINTLDHPELKRLRGDL